MRKISKNIIVLAWCIIITVLTFALIETREQLNISKRNYNIVKKQICKLNDPNVTETYVFGLKIQRKDEEK